MKNGVIFDMKRCAIHDGPGVRSTVFFKGCPLKCLWCHNPEGLEANHQIIVIANRCKKDCDECILVCPSCAISKIGRAIIIDETRCDECLKCVEACSYEALEVVGKEVSVQEVVREIEKDQIFFDESGGGVTFSGGEPLAQPEFLKALLKEFKKKGIHTVVDTSGYVSYEIFKEIFGYIDLFLYDIKVMNDEKHKEYTGVSNKVILENLRTLSEKGKSVIVRIPLISGINDDDENILESAEYLASFGNIKKIDLLAYQKGGCEKYKRLGKASPLVTFNSPSQERIRQIKKILSAYGFSVRLGG